MNFTGIPLQLLQIPGGILLTDLSTKKFHLDGDTVREHVLKETTWSPGRTWPKSDVDIQLPILKEPFPGHPEYQVVCPACGSTNVKEWEKTEKGQTFGGKDCQDCHALSRRWNGAGIGRLIWVCGPKIHTGMTVTQTEAILLPILGPAQHPEPAHALTP